MFRDLTRVPGSQSNISVPIENIRKISEDITNDEWFERVGYTSIPLCSARLSRVGWHPTSLGERARLEADPQRLGSTWLTGQNIQPVAAW